MRRARRPRGPRLRGFSFNKLVPNIITVMAFCASLSGLRYALQDNWDFAIGMIFLAAILDTLDGRMARLLSAQSKFGAELDSLSDFVAFGVVPGLIMYLWSLQTLGNFGWMATLFYATCCGLRLARFNVKLDDDNKPAFAYNFFTGVPAPAGAGLCLLPIILELQLDWSIGELAVLMGCWVAAVGLLMVSQIPTFSFKRMKMPRRWALPVLIGAGFIVTGVVSAPWFMLAILIITYMVTIPASFFSFRKLLWEADLQESEVLPETQEDVLEEDK